MLNFSPPWRMRTLFRRVVIVSLSANLMLILILFSPLNAFMHHLTYSNDPLPEHGEAVVVMSSNFPFPTKNGMMCISSLIRLQKGLQLYREGRVGKIIAFGGVEIEGTGGKTIAKAMKEQLMLYGVPEQDIIVQDAILGRDLYYDNMLHMMKTHKEFDWNKVIFVTSTDQSLRVRKCLVSEVANPIVSVSEPYEVTADWALRFHLFRVVMNELLFALPYFQFTDRFADYGDPNRYTGPTKPRFFLP